MAFERGKKSLRIATNQWDIIALKREEQIRSGKDHSANEVLAPAIISRMAGAKAVLDIGCGTGWLTARVGTVSGQVTGIDPSKKSISVARELNAAPNCTYAAESVEKFAGTGQAFGAAFANMAVSSAPDMKSFLAASRRLLKRKAHFVLTLPHPCFWPLYWGYDQEPWFHYEQEVAIQSNFRIQAQRTKFKTTHFHRPLSTYLLGVEDADFSLVEFKELYGLGFDLPRFLLLDVVAK